MKESTWKMKKAVWKIKDMVLKIFFAPISVRKGEVLFISSNGMYYCNLKYIDKELRRRGFVGEIIWCGNENNSDFTSKGIRVISPQSWRYYYYAERSQFIIFNDSVISHFIKKNGQIYIDTWHGGGAYKRCDKTFINNRGLYWKMCCYNIMNKIDYFISSSKQFSIAMKEDTGLPIKVFYPCGMPRNDIFFDKEKIKNIRLEVLGKYKININKKVVLYAPTFREYKNENAIDFKNLLDALSVRFGGEFVLLLRRHPHRAEEIFTGETQNEGVIDVSNYVDMQELLCAADILITDYSSSMWDYSFTYRPCFIFANDIESYTGERGFHTPIEKWPFPIARDNSELIHNIMVFDEKKYKANVDQHHKELGSYEDGHGAEKICQLIERLCEKQL